MATVHRAVVVHRRTELDDLLNRHGTRGAAEFFLRTRHRTLAEVQERHDRQDDALRHVRAALPADWRRGSVERSDLSRFPFEPDDVVLVVGQDGLVANVAAYLSGQPVLGIDPEPGRNAGVLVRHRPDTVGPVLAGIAAGPVVTEQRAMARAALDDGQQVHAVNDVFVGHAGHQSARYRLHVPDASDAERQSSSGIVVATGTGATGWAASLVRERAHRIALPGPTDPALAWFVREAWPSPATGTDHTQGLLPAGASLDITVETDALVVFGDGQEADRLVATWGQRVTVDVSDRTLRLVPPTSTGSAAPTSWQ